MFLALSRVIFYLIISAPPLAHLKTKFRFQTTPGPPGNEISFPNHHWPTWKRNFVSQPPWLRSRNPLPTLPYAPVRSPTRPYALLRPPTLWEKILGDDGGDHFFPKSPARRVKILGDDGEALLFPKIPSLEHKSPWR